MAFERHHPNPRIQQNMEMARKLRAAYVRQALSRIVAWATRRPWGRGVKRHPELTPRIASSGDVTRARR